MKKPIKSLCSSMWSLLEPWQPDAWSARLVGFRCLPRTIHCCQQNAVCRAQISLEALKPVHLSCLQAVQSNGAIKAMPEKAPQAATLLAKRR